VEEFSADLGRHRGEHGFLTPEKIRAFAGPRDPEDVSYGYEDLRDAIQRGLERGRTPEQLADDLNNFVAKVQPQPKAVRGEPTQAIAESKKRRKIRIRVKRK
jgi:hypothetical protein